uniref:hypothetical protein n=1 Tax=Paraburkholderia caribensis TaxID=75105 RepID=UPI001ABA6BB3
MSSQECGTERSGDDAPTGCDAAAASQPGSSLNVGGNLTFQPGSTLQVAANPQQAGSVKAT